MQKVRKQRIQNKQACFEQKGRIYKIEEDGKRTIEPNPTVQIIGMPDLQVITTGKLQVRKKDLTKMVNGAANLLERFLHGFMQERKEIETAESREN